MADEEQRSRDESGRFLPNDEADREKDEANQAAESETTEGSGDESTESLKEGDWVEDISDTVAPSVGPHSKVVHHAHVEHEVSDVDAMGLHKRRAVVGGQYGATFAKQATLYGSVLAVIAALVIGFILLAGELDQPPETAEDEAPWSSPDAPQEPPAPLQ